jgi:hypothetical protein
MDVRQMILIEHFKVSMLKPEADPAMSIIGKQTLPLDGVRVKCEACTGSSLHCFVSLKALRG